MNKCQKLIPLEYLKTDKKLALTDTAANDTKTKSFDAVSLLKFV